MPGKESVWTVFLIVPVLSTHSLISELLAANMVVWFSLAAAGVRLLDRSQFGVRARATRSKRHSIVSIRRA